MCRRCSVKQTRLENDCQHQNSVEMCVCVLQMSLSSQLWCSAWWGIHSVCQCCTVNNKEFKSVAEIFFYSSFCPLLAITETYTAGSRDRLTLVQRVLKKKKKWHNFIDVLIHVMIWYSVWIHRCPEKWAEKVEFMFLLHIIVCSFIDFATSSFFSVREEAFSLF